MNSIEKKRKRNFLAGRKNPAKSKVFTWKIWQAIYIYIYIFKNVCVHSVWLPSTNTQYREEEMLFSFVDVQQSRRFILQKSFIRQYRYDVIFYFYSVKIKKTGSNRLVGH